MTIVRTGARAPSPEDRFRGMFAEHYGAVFGYCARRLGRDDAPDAAAEVFGVAWRKVRRVPDEPETLPWLYGVARNVVSNHTRAARRRMRLGAKMVAAGRDEPRYEHPESIEPVLGALRPADREVLMLVAWEGLDPHQLGRALGCSAQAASVRLHRARARLTEIWNDMHGGSR